MAVVRGGAAAIFSAIAIFFVAAAPSSARAAVSSAPQTLFSEMICSVWSLWDDSCIRERFVQYAVSSDTAVDDEVEKRAVEFLRGAGDVVVSRQEREVLRGPQGERGLEGARGVAGADGRDGVDGKDGADGEDGKDGDDGEDGQDATALFGSSIDSSEITDGTITFSDWASNACTDGQLPKYDAASSRWVCGDDVGGTSYSAGAGLSLAGGAFSIDLTSANAWSGIQSFGGGFIVNGNTYTNLAGTGLSFSGGTLSSSLGASIESSEITDGTVVAADIADGVLTFAKLASNSCTSGQIPKYNGSAWVCSVDDSTAYAAGTGLSLSSGTFALDIDGLASVSSVASTDALAVQTASGARKITRSDLFGDVLGALNYRGTWNATANTPALASSTGTKGYYYVVSVAGSTTLDGVSSWSPNDWAVFNGTVWERVQTTNAVTSVFGRTGSVIASSGDYNASQITNTANGTIGAVTVQNALNELDSEKLATGLNSGLIWVGNASNQAAAAALSGDATLSNAGVLTIGANAVALGADTTGNYVATIADNGSGIISVANSGTENAAITLGIADDSLDFTKLADGLVLDAGTSVTFGSNDLTFAITGAGLPRFTRTSAGQWMSFSDGTDSLGIFNRAGTPEGSVAADKGSLVIDTANGNLYIKTTDTVNTGWSKFGIGTGDMLSTNNLSDLTSAATARTNLGLGNVENTALSTWTGSTNVATLGTVTAGTWQGTALADAYIDNALTVSGGTINGSAIGVTTASTGSFTTLAASGGLTLSGSAANIALGSNYLSGDGDDEGVYVDSSGNVGIGIATLTNKLSVDGGIYLASTTPASTTNALYAVGSTLYWNGSALGGGVSPLTTKGDLYAYSTTGDRLPVGADGQILVADSSQATGLKWTDPVNSGANITPSFSVHKSSVNQTVSDGVETLLTWNTEAYDTNNNFAVNRFAPTVAGKYLLNLQTYCIDAALARCGARIFKNGVVAAQNNAPINGAGEGFSQVNVILDLAAGDYVEAYGVVWGGTGILGDPTLTYFTGSRIDGGNGLWSSNNLDISYTSGNVGIGTAAPSTELEVVGDITSKGTKWTSRTSAVDNTWTSVAYGNGLFVAVANSGTGNRVMTSPDGINWTARTSAADNNWNSVAYGNGLFVAVANSGTGNRVMTSPDGINWTARTSAADNNWNSVAYGNGLFVAVAQSGTGNRVMTSPDGINWTARTSAADNNWTAITYGNGLFVAVANSGTGNRVMTSPDGINWTARTSAADNSWDGITYGNGLFVAVSLISGSGERVMTSSDGINWTIRTSAADNGWRSVTYGNGLFVAVAQSGTGNRVMTSPDGINWTARTSAADNSWRSVAYGNGLFVAVAATSTSGSVMTSGKTETNMLASTSLSLSAVTAALAANSLDNANYSQTWDWSTADTETALTMNVDALTTGTGLAITSSYASGNSTNGLLYVANTGAVTDGTIVRIAANSTAGSGLTVLANGNIGIGTATPSNALDVNGGITIESATPSTTTNALYAIGSTLYWDGHAISTAATEAYGRAWRTADYVIGANNTWYAVPLNAGDAELNGITHSTSTNAERVQVTEAGVYDIDVGATFFDNGVAHENFIAIGKNGTTPLSGSSASGRPGAVANQTQSYGTNITTYLSAGDYVSVLVASSNVAGTTADVHLVGSPTGLVSTYLNIKRNSGGIPGDYVKQNGNSLGSALTLGTNDAYGLSFETNGLGRMFIDSSGNVGVGTTAPNYRFQVGETSNYGYVTSTGAWASSSDIRFKEHIVPITGGLDAVMRMEGIRYTVIGDSALQIGFSAQDMQKILPEVVTTDSEGHLGISYASLTPVLAAAIQDQQSEIEGHAGSIIALDMRTQNIVAAEDGKTVFKGTVVADTFKANHIEGLDIVTGSQLSDVDAALVSQGQTLNDISAQVALLRARLDGTELSLHLKDLQVSGGVTFKGAAEFQGPAIFKKLAEFIDTTVFRKDVEFQGRIALNSDTFGTFVIPEGKTRVRVSFAQPFEKAPLVALTLQEATFSSYAVKKITKDGFIAEIYPAEDKPLAFVFSAFVSEDNGTKVEVLADEEQEILDQTASMTSVPDTSGTTEEDAPIGDAETDTESAGTSGADTSVTDTESVVDPASTEETTPEDSLVLESNGTMNTDN